MMKPASCRSFFGPIFAAVVFLGPAFSPVWPQDDFDRTTCAEEDCHAELSADLMTSPHGVLDSKGLANRASASFSCIACHGDVTLHVEDEGGPDNIFAFAGDTAPEIIRQRCQTCHAGDHPRFPASPHAIAGLDCADCHSIHEPAPSAATGARLMAKPGNETCRDCHGDLFALFDLNERHRLKEGVLECASCHDPHAPQPRTWLGGFKQQACQQCHTDKHGPFVFEHGSIRVEGCTACHDPHGSANRHMLSFQRVEDLCLSCHATLPFFHLRLRGQETNCVNCHIAIHGSNMSPQFLR